MSITVDADHAARSEVDASTAPRVPAPALSVFDATMITVGIVIGAGIFQTPTMVAGIAGTPTLMLLAWVLGGVLSLVGALTYAELATTYPSAGGDYTFLSRAYGRNVSFLFAWARSMVICTGSIALLGFILGDYLTRLFSLGAYSSAIYAAIALVVLSAINLIGLRSSSRMQNALTLLEITGVLVVAIAGMTLDVAPATAPTVSAESGGAFGLAMVFVLLTYGGWNEAAYVSAEVRGGPRAMARTLLWGIGIITTLYVLANLAYVHALGLDGVRSSSVVAADLMQSALGPVGATLLSCAVALSALGSANATIITGARTTYALGRDFGAFHLLG